MQISHAEAHKLIQQAMDNSLLREDENTLSNHLQTCPECSTYRDELRDVEVLLRSVMSKHWALTPVPLGVSPIKGKVHFNPQGRLGTQLVMISLMVMLIMLGTWRFVNLNIVPTKTMQIAPIPTPSTQMTGTRTLAPNCDAIVYIVKKGDTLESIATTFSTTTEAIVEWNHLQSTAIEAGNKIEVPVCFTPSATVRPATFTVTFSPAPLTASSSP
jgi:hypothetical protein